MKNLNHVFLERSEIQFLGIPVLFAVFSISSMWGSQNNFPAAILFEKIGIFWARWN